MKILGIEIVNFSYKFHFDKLQGSKDINKIFVTLLVVPPNGDVTNEIRCRVNNTFTKFFALFFYMDYWSGKLKF